jgi:hypothetical protein
MRATRPFGSLGEWVGRSEAERVDPPDERSIGSDDGDGLALPEIKSSVAEVADHVPGKPAPRPIGESTWTHRFEEWDDASVGPYRKTPPAALSYRVAATQPPPVRGSGKIQARPWKRGTRQSADPSAAKRVSCV